MPYAMNLDTTWPMGDEARGALIKICFEQIKCYN